MSLITDPVGATATRVTPGTSTAGQNAEFKLGTRAKGTDNSEYVYVQAAAALLTNTTDPNAVAIDKSFQANLMTTALALADQELGFAPQTQINQYDFFWAQVHGTNFNARVAASASANKYLRTTTTAGRLGTASTASAVTFDGVVITAAASASTSANNSVRNVLATKGRAVRQGLSTFI